MVFGVGEIAAITHADLLPKRVTFTWCVELGELEMWHWDLQSKPTTHSALWGIEKRTPTTCLACITSVLYPQATISQKFCEQLIKQVKEQAIPVFDAAHPGCQALFIFDQSSAHASLPPDSLKALR